VKRGILAGVAPLRIVLALAAMGASQLCATRLAPRSLASPGSSAGVAPTVNGLFFGDGDNTRYQLYAVSQYGSRLYFYLDNPVLYVALVISHSFNDNVFDRRGRATAYIKDAGWNNRPASQLYNSEFSEFILSCGAASYTWKQAYAYRPGGVGAFVSDHLGPAGGGIAPPGIASASSFAWNINNYEAKAPGDRLWDMYVHGSQDTNWKSPWLGSGDYVIGLDGYPASGAIGYSTQFEYEWPMVYEWSVDLSAVCAGNSLYLIAGSSHHSPSKIGDVEDDPFGAPDLGDSEAKLTDFGDLPAAYGTLQADDGARHTIVIGDAYLGGNMPDAETDGQPSADALGDDLAGNDDEDGIVFLTPLAPGRQALIQVTAAAQGYLSAFVDWDANGTLDPVTLISATGPAPVAPGTLGDTHLPAAGAYTLRVGVPAHATGLMYSRWRLTNLPDQGGNSPTGRASSGEVEDYALASIGDRVWHDLDADGAQGPGEPGMADVAVRLLDGSGVPMLDADGDPITTMTDRDGNYTFPGLPPGQYRVEFVAPGGYTFTQQGRGCDPDLDSDPDAITGRTPGVTLAPGQTRVDLDAGLVATPTSVGLAAFRAGVRGRSAVVSWETGSELDILGFYLYRSDASGGQRLVLAEGFIPARATGAATGERYEFEDGDIEGGDAYYVLEVQTASGTNATEPVRVWLRPQGWALRLLPIGRR